MKISFAIRHLLSLNIISLLLLFIILVSACSTKEVFPTAESGIKTMNLIIKPSDSNLVCKVSLYIPKNSNRNKVIYFFHGDAGNSESWLSFSEIFKTVADKQNMAVASVSFGPKWFLVNSGSKDAPHITIPSFINEIMPEIENHISSAITNRIVSGFSMGGYNAAQLAYRKPKLFSQVILISPSILPVYPYDSETTIKEYIKEMEKKYGGIKQTLRKLILGHSRIESSILYVLSYQKKRFPSKSVWEENNMLGFVKNTVIGENSFPPTYISAGTRDINSFYEGCLILHSQLLKNNTDVKFDSLNGGHLVHDSKSVIKFILDHCR